MKSFTILAILLVLTGSAYAAPAIEFGQTRADLGFVSSGDSVEHTFEFTNRGDEDLIIHKVTTS